MAIRLEGQQQQHQQAQDGSAVVAASNSAPTPAEVITDKALFKPWQTHSKHQEDLLGLKEEQNPQMRKLLGEVSFEGGC